MQEESLSNLTEAERRAQAGQVFEALAPMRDLIRALRSPSPPSRTQNASGGVDVEGREGTHIGKRRRIGK